MLEYEYKIYKHSSDGDFNGLLRDNPGAFELDSSSSNVHPNRIQNVIKDTNDYFCSEKKNINILKLYLKIII